MRVCDACVINKATYITERDRAKSSSPWKGEKRKRVTSRYMATVPVMWEGFWILPRMCALEMSPTPLFRVDHGSRQKQGRGGRPKTPLEMRSPCCRKKTSPSRRAEYAILGAKAAWAKKHEELKYGMLFPPTRTPNFRGAYLLRLRIDAGPGFFALAHTHTAVCQMALGCAPPSSLFCNDENSENTQ